MSRSRVMRADPCAITAIPPTITKSTPCETRACRRDWRRSSGHSANGLTCRQRELAHVLIAGLEGPQALLRRELQVLEHHRLVDAGLRLPRGQGQLPSTRPQRPLDRCHARAGAVGLQTRDRGLRGAQARCQGLLAEAGRAASLAYELSGCHREKTISIQPSKKDDTGALDLHSPLH